MMPELPEVETIRIGLQKYLVGHRVEDIDVRMPKQLSGNPRDVVGAQVTTVRRFGKGLVIDLSNDFSLAVHVKMTGQLIYKRVSSVSRASKVSRVKVDVETLPDVYTHVVFHLDKGGLLFYRDIRQFGWIKVVKSDSVANLPYFKELGPEPLKDLTREKFTDILNKKRTPVKQLLMDQKIFAGIGNIYANDALYVAGIHPKRPSSSLTLEEQTKLLKAIEAVLLKGLQVGGASEWQFVNALGEAGDYQNFFQIYRKDGKPCPKCGTIVASIRMGGRGTFFCPRCQK